MKKYTKEQILIAAEIGEVSMIDARHIGSLLDDAVIMERERKLRKPQDDLKNETANSNNTMLGAVNLDYKLISNIQFDGIDHKDYPDYCDAYIVSADYDGTEMTEEQIELLNDDRDYVYEKLMDYLY